MAVTEVTTANSYTDTNRAVNPCWAPVVIVIEIQAPLRGNCFEIYEPALIERDCMASYLLPNQSQVLHKTIDDNNQPRQQIPNN